MRTDFSSERQRPERHATVIKERASKKKKKERKKGKKTVKASRKIFKK